MNIEQVANVILSIGARRSVLLIGEPGVGKSSLLGLLAARLPHYQSIYIDCPVIDLPDIGLPEIADGQVWQRPAAIWGCDDPRPKIIMLDELAKASSLTRLFFTRLLLDRTVGQYTLPPGSIVFATSNRAEDGVGDAFPAHLINRVIIIRVAKPTAQEWADWGATVGIHPVILSFADQFPHIFDPAGAEGNPYVFNPRTPAEPFVSPRSLHAASDILHNMPVDTPDDVLLAVLSGTVGTAAARDIITYRQLYHQLPVFDAVVSDPLGAPIPDAPAACIVTAYAFAARVTKDNIAPLIKYFTRLSGEYASIFARHAAKAGGAAILLNKGFIGWLKANAWMF